MLSKLKSPSHSGTSASADDGRWRLADLEAAQRRNPYAAGRGDGPERRNRWTKVFSKAA